MFSEIRWAISHVLTSPARLRSLVGLGPNGVGALIHFLRSIVPQAARELQMIERRAAEIPDDRLRAQALASTGAKAYHVAGAAILATFLPNADAARYIAIVSPLESIYDFLDNLCDRHPEVSAAAYPVLHQALFDALDPRTELHDYYACGPSGSDGGYLRGLVEQTRRGLAALPGSDALAPFFSEAASFYSDLQTYKHYPPREREAACVAWYERNSERFDELSWWEFACAAGSQFQVYAPLYLVFLGQYNRLDDIYAAYFPAVSAIHVLLDYFIDQAEDREHAELNFIDCYPNFDALKTRVTQLSKSAEAGFERLPHSERHRFVLRVMSLFYLTHPKVYEQRLDPQARALLIALR
ncbi:MAG: tetraprenyl-beta-curcumene synthase family protein [Candidatus Eremiobacteraeota bacterium]|nr:tetraprenyl-beta-curcumene synthase family protein [Candidatus Eremiobacteraeota bacterium]